MYVALCHFTGEGAPCFLFWLRRVVVDAYAVRVAGPGMRAPRCLGRVSGPQDVNQGAALWRRNAVSWARGKGGMLATFGPQPESGEFKGVVFLHG